MNSEVPSAGLHVANGGDRSAAGGWLAGWRPTEAALGRQFAVLSFLVIALITATLCVVISSQLRRDLLHREWAGTADFIRTEALQLLTPGDFTTPRSRQAGERFRAFYAQAIAMPEIVRVKVYDAGGRVIWSDEARLIGATFPDNPQLQKALRGRTTVNLETDGRKEENVFERDEQSLVEVYVPIAFPGDPRLVGVVETYKEPTQVFADIRRGQVMVVATALAGGLLLYVSLFWIVRRAARRIEAQHAALEHQSREVAAANEELRSVQKQLVAAERMAAIGEVVTAVAHGIRNPLANIRAAAQVGLLDGDGKDRDEPRRAPRSLGHIVAEVDRLEGRVRELLQFVRPAERKSQPLDLNAAARGALALMAGRLSECDIKVDERLAAAVPAVPGDPALLEQVFMNLIGNAIDATPAGGMIAVTTGTEPDADGRPGVFAEIRDTGRGIDPAEIDRIFDLFYTTKSQGTGVGLALARKFVEAHGGRIAVRSAPGEGAAFRVVLPVCTEAAPCR